MDSVSASPSDQLYSLIGMPAATPTTPTVSSGSSSTNSIGPAATVLLSSLQSQGAATATLFAGLEATSPSFFGGSSALSLLNAQGTNALQYLLPAGSMPGQTLDATA